MKSRMMIGKFMNTGSWIHQLDPRSKSAAMFLFMFTVFLIDSYLDIATVALFSLFIQQSTKIPLYLFLRAIRPLILIVFFIFGFHLLLDSEGPRLMAMGPFTFYAGGLERGVLAAFRMLLFVAFTAILTFTTKPERLAQGLGYLFRPLKWFGASPGKITMMIGISLRFVPTVFEEAEKVWKAQVSRGMQLKGKTVRQKASLLISLLVPVTTGAFRRAAELAASMEARGYRLGAPRSACHVLTWSRQDTLFLAMFLMLLAGIGITKMV